VTVTFNHTIIAATDKHASAAFYRELFGLPEAPSWGLFVNVLLDEGVLLQFAEPPVDIQMQHYAFLVDDELFGRCLAYIEERGITYWADPQMKRPGETNSEHGGRGVYFKDPAGHAIELITRPYL
jgi:catechol 2,3-dioxygenase-like lactoylglutathione lyase family enzyme